MSESGTQAQAQKEGKKETIKILSHAAYFRHEFGPGLQHEEMVGQFHDRVQCRLS